MLQAILGLVGTEKEMVKPEKYTTDTKKRVKLPTLNNEPSAEEPAFIDDYIQQLRLFIDEVLTENSAGNELPLEIIWPIVRRLKAIGAFPDCDYISE